MVTVMWKKTRFTGVRYREHSERKHGIKFDRYFAIRYQRDGKRSEEGLGWASDGWTLEKAALTLAGLKEAYKTGKGETRLSEKRHKSKIQKENAKRDSITFETVFIDKYFPIAKADKVPQSSGREKGLFKNWISPEIGALPLREIAPIHLEKIKKNMRDAGKADRSIQYALAVIRQVFNFSRRHGYFIGDNPVSKVKMPKVNNRRVRFLTLDEAENLMDELKKENQEMWEMALISLHCGLRASEIFRLTWIDVDTEQGIITVKNSQKAPVRHAFMTQPIKDMLLNKKTGKASDLFFPSPDGGERGQVPETLIRIVDKIGLNEGVTDRRNKVVFHTLRHTYASWLVQNGEDLYVVKDRLGHSTMAMTERYSHLAPDNARRTVKTLENFLNGNAKSEKEITVSEVSEDVKKANSEI